MVKVARVSHAWRTHAQAGESWHAVWLPNERGSDRGKLRTLVRTFPNALRSASAIGVSIGAADAGRGFVTMANFCRYACRPAAQEEEEDEEEEKKNTLSSSSSSSSSRPRTSPPWLSSVPGNSHVVRHDRRGLCDRSKDGENDNVARGAASLDDADAEADAPVAHRFLVQVPEVRNDLADRVHIRIVHSVAADAEVDEARPVDDERVVIRANTTLRRLLVNDGDIQLGIAASLANAFPRLERLALHAMSESGSGLGSVPAYFRFLFSGLRGLRTLSVSVAHLSSAWRMAANDVLRRDYDKAVHLPPQLESLAVLESCRTSYGVRASDDSTGRRACMHIALSRAADARLATLVLRDESVAILASLAGDDVVTKRSDDTTGTPNHGASSRTASDNISATVGGDCSGAARGSNFSAIGRVELVGASLLVGADLGRLMRLPRLECLAIGGMRLDEAADWATSVAVAPWSSAPTLGSDSETGGSNRAGRSPLVDSMRTLKLVDCKVRVCVCARSFFTSTRLLRILARAHAHARCRRQVSHEFVVAAMRLYPRLRKFQERRVCYAYNPLWYPDIAVELALTALAVSDAFRAGHLKRVHLSGLHAVMFGSPSTRPAADTGTRCRCRRGTCVDCVCATSGSGRCGPHCHLPPTTGKRRSKIAAAAARVACRCVDERECGVRCGDAMGKTTGIGYSGACQIAPRALASTVHAELEPRDGSRAPRCRIWIHRRSADARLSHAFVLPALATTDPRGDRDCGGDGDSDGDNDGDGKTSAATETHVAAAARHTKATKHSACIEAVVYSGALARLVAPGSDCLVSFGKVSRARVTRVAREKELVGALDSGIVAAAHRCKNAACVCRAPKRRWDPSLGPVRVGADKTWVRAACVADLFEATVAAAAAAPGIVPLAARLPRLGSALRSAAAAAAAVA
jgi:hypothetical protein